jgi:hypothetical protein
MGSPAFETAFTELLVPVLERLGFRQVPEPPGWMQPSKLYQQEGTWLGVELDERDGYVAITLGRLFRLRDVMPRAIVRGPFHYEVTGQYEQSALARLLQRVGTELPDAAKNLEKRWPSTPALEHQRWVRSTKGEAGYARYLAALGPQLTVWPPRAGEADSPDGAA